MKKLYTSLFALLLVLGFLVGCGQDSTEKTKEETPISGEDASTEQQQSDYPLTIIDALENEVIIDKEPDRIVSLIPSNTEIVYGLGLGDKIVGVSDHDNYPEEVAEKERVGAMEYNVEKIISLKPNLVLAHASSAHNSEAGLKQLRDAGIAVVVIRDAHSIAEVYDSIIMVGAATGAKETAEKLVTDLKTEIEEIQEKAADIKEEDRKTVFVEVSPAPEIYSVGTNTFMNEMLEIINAENVVTEEGWPKMDEEAIIERNPEVIITTHGHYTENPVESVMSREGWQNISAVKNERVVNVDSDTVNRTGPRIAQGVEELAKAVYPELFK